MKSKTYLMRYSFTFHFKLIPFILVLLLFSGCYSIKPSATKSGKIYFETFYVGEEGTQYFIKPILFKDEESNEELILDITFRYKNNIKDSAVVNFSIKSSMIFKAIDSVKILNQNMEVASTKIELLFNQKNKKGFTSRFTTKFDLKEIKELYNNDNWEFVIINQSEIKRYRSQKNANNAINKVRDNVFILM